MPTLSFRRHIVLVAVIWAAELCRECECQQLRNRGIVDMSGLHLETTAIRMLTLSPPAPPLLRTSSATCNETGRRPCRVCGGWHHS